MKRISGLIWFLILTIVTQVGGVVYLLNLALVKFWWKPRKRQWLKRQLMFIGLYVLASLLIVPPLAKLNHRQPLPCYKVTTLRPQNWLTVICNRHYVHEDLYKVIVKVSDDFNRQSTEKEGTLILNYLDANFPFIDGFPLIPHLSHNDGKKLDLAFRYESKGEQPPTNNTRSLFGYGVYVEPTPEEINQTAICKEKRWQYDITKYIGIPINGWLTYDGWETKRLMQLLVASEIDKVFIEPHLKQRMDLQTDKIRFHGCHAVRHDDHIHVQIR